MEELFIYWVSEREKIRKAKASGVLPPWTEDPILQAHRFCNVRRRDDKVSQWLIENFYSKAIDPIIYTSDAFIQWASLNRFINWPPTLIEAFGATSWWGLAGYGGEEITRIILNRQARGAKIFSNAYLVRGALIKGVSKIPYIVETTCGLNVKRRMPIIRKALETRSREKVASALGSIHGWGTFMAGQVTDDLTWSPLLSDPIDNFTWAPQGPGSKRGYNRMRGLPLYASIEPEQWSSWLQVWRGLVIMELGEEALAITLHDIQNCLCEFDKYVRVKNGEGRMKNKYQPKPEGTW